jgi:hypothetical protein
VAQHRISIADVAPTVRCAHEARRHGGWSMPYRFRADWSTDRVILEYLLPGDLRWRYVQRLRLVLIA